jgi:hypothetical protein
MRFYATPLRPKLLWLSTLAITANAFAQGSVSVLYAGSLVSVSSSNPMMEGPWCRFRREARARERHRYRSGG